MGGIFDLHGKGAVVTGGGTGIGLAMAMALAEAGATVSIWGRRQVKLDEAVAAAAAAGITLTSRSVDVADAGAVRTAMRDDAAALGSLDVLVVNAGVGGGRVPLLEVTEESYRDVLATNLDGALWSIQAAADVMTGQGRGGSIITIASLAAVDATPANYAYGVSKAGVVSLTKAAAVELARHRIRVNAVLPGWIQTDMTGGLDDSGVFDNHLKPRVPARRWGVPEDFAGIAVYLASDASAYQTGTSTLIDGGYAIF